MTHPIFLVCGGRHYADRHHLDKVLDDFFKSNPMACIVQGGAPGADTMVKNYCAANGRPCLTMHAWWDCYGPLAGSLRNQWMIDYCRPQAVIAFPGGPGTKDMINRANGQKIQVFQV